MNNTIKKYAWAVALPSLFTWIPCLIFNPERIYQPHGWIFFVSSFLMIATQPSASFIPTSSSMKTQHDRQSALIIMLVSYPFLILSTYQFIAGEFNPYVKVNQIGGILGTLFSFVGVTLRIVAIQTLGRQFTSTLQIVPKHSIIQHGLFGMIRHPSYLGAILILSAPPLLYHQWILFLVLLSLITAAYMYRIRIEEKMLILKFPNEYSEYQKKVSMLLPNAQAFRLRRMDSSRP